MQTRRALLALVAATAVVIPTAAIAAPAHMGTGAPSHESSSAWLPTATRALPLARTALGALDGRVPLRISIGLQLRHRAEMDRLAEAVSTPGSVAFGHFLTPTEVRARFGPTASSVAAVEGWLRQAGFQAVSVSRNGLLVDATASASTVMRTFRTTLERYLVRGHEVYANTTAALVPAALHGVVASVLGLSDVPMALPHTVTPHSTDAGVDIGGFTPAQIAKIYDASSLPAARRMSVAVVAMGDMKPIIANLRIAERKAHSPRVPVTVRYGGPQDVITQNNPLTGNAEWDLDTQMATMEAGTVKRLYIYDEQTFTDEDVVRAINSFVADNRAISGSASLGECDYIAWADGAMLMTDESLEEGALQGQSFFASTGDNGSFCPEITSTGVPGGLPGTSWPAEGTWTTAVGGTTLLADSDGNVSQEIAWIGGGGGITPFETAGDWTTPANPASQLDQFINQGGRAVPDISTDADGNVSPVLIYIGGNTPAGIGGTSVSAPTMNGLWARLQGASGGKLGLASVRLYGVYNAVNPGENISEPLGVVTIPNLPAKPVTGFRDITLGGDGLFVATPGYDYTTGIGAPLVSQLLKQFRLQQRD